MKYYYFFLILLLASCSSDGDVAYYRVEKSTSHLEKKETQTPNQEIAVDTNTSSSTLKWIAPEGWTEQAGSGFRLVTFTFPLKESTSGECYITSLGGDGGGLAGNINRWRQQIGLSILDESEITKSLQNIENSKLENGVLAKLENSENKKGMLTAIFTLKDQTIFVKMSLDLPNLQQQEKPFIQLCQSLSLKPSEEK